MKKVMLVMVAVVGMALSTRAQLSDVLTNLPTTSLEKETVGLSVGMLMDGANTFKSAEIVDWNVSKLFFVGGELTSGTANSVVDSLGARAGVYRNMNATTRVFGFLGGKRDWDKSRWEGFGGLGVAYAPFANQSNMLANFSLTIEQRIRVTGERGAPPTQTFSGLRYSY